MIGCRGAACGCSGTETEVLSGRARGCSGTAFLMGRHAVMRFKVLLIRAEKEVEGAMVGR